MCARNHKVHRCRRGSNSRVVTYFPQKHERTNHTIMWGRLVTTATAAPSSAELSEIDWQLDVTTLLVEIGWNLAMKFHHIVFFGHIWLNRRQCDRGSDLNGLKWHVFSLQDDFKGTTGAGVKDILADLLSVFLLTAMFLTSLPLPEHCFLQLPLRTTPLLAP